MSVIKTDILRGRKVVIAPRRGGRPKENEDKAFVCPFCPGREESTPPEIERVTDGKGGWKIRVVPNKYPILENHEVIVDSPDHNSDLDTFSKEHLNQLMEVWRKRVEAYRDHPYVLLFRNYGKGAGASILHPHTQVVALDTVPDIAKREAKALSGKGCLLCSGYGKRIVEKGGYAVTVPEVQLLSYEVWIHPVDHASHFSPYPPFAELLSKVICELKSRFGVSDYNLILHQAPFGYDYHWHVEIIPRLGHFAGFELGTGMSVVFPTRIQIQL